MKLYICTDIFNELIFGNKTNKNQIANELVSLVKKKHFLMSSINSIQEVLKKSPNQNISDKIFPRLIHSMNQFIEISETDCHLALKFLSESGLSYSNCLEIAIAIRSQATKIISLDKNINNQNLVPTIIIKCM